MLFENYPNITYVLKNKDIILVDIFRNIVFKNIETSNAFDDYYIQDGESPENISARIYGNTSYSWLILLINNITNTDTEWFESSEEYLRGIERDIGGDAFYISDLPELQTGDVIVKVITIEGNQATDIDENIICYVDSFDPYFRKIRGICGSGTFHSGDDVLFARKNANSGIVEQIEFHGKYTSKILFTESYRQSVEYFVKSNNIVIDPYRKISSGLIETTSVDPGVIYTNPSDSLTIQNFAKTLIYNYGTSGGILPDSIIKITKDSDTFNKYIKRQKIKILKPELLSIVLTTLDNAIQSDTVGRIFKVELNA